MIRKPKRPRDPNQLAKDIVHLATGEAKEPAPAYKTEAQQAAAVLGRLGGLKGGKARAKSLSATRRKAIAKKAARTRWKTARRQG